MDQVSKTHRRRNRSGSSVALGRRQLRDPQAFQGQALSLEIPYALHADQRPLYELGRRWFRDLRQKRLRRGTFKSVRQLQHAIFHYVEQHNDRAQGYLWKALPEVILAKVRGARPFSITPRQHEALDYVP